MPVPAPGSERGSVSAGIDPGKREGQSRLLTHEGAVDLMRESGHWSIPPLTEDALWRHLLLLHYMAIIIVWSSICGALN